MLLLIICEVWERGDYILFVTKKETQHLSVSLGSIRKGVLFLLGTSVNHGVFACVPGPVNGFMVFRFISYSLQRLCGY